MLPSIFTLRGHDFVLLFVYDPDMLYDEEAASRRWKWNPKNFGPYIKSIKFLGSGKVKTRVGRVSGNNKKILGLCIRANLVQNRGSRPAPNEFWRGEGKATCPEQIALRASCVRLWPPLVYDKLVREDEDLTVDRAAYQVTQRYRSTQTAAALSLFAGLHRCGQERDNN